MLSRYLPNCGKTGWDGCGQHVDVVMRSVPVATVARAAPKVLGAQSVPGRGDGSSAVDPVIHG